MWKKIKEIPPLIYSIIAIISAIAGLFIWVFGYFATHAELEKVECWAKINIKINSKQISQTILLNERYKLKDRIQNLENKKHSDNLTRYEKEMLDENKKLSEENEENMKKCKNETEKLLEIVRSGEFFNADGQCRSEI